MTAEPSRGYVNVYYIALIWQEKSYLGMCCKHGPRPTFPTGGRTAAYRDVVIGAQDRKFSVVARSATPTLGQARPVASQCAIIPSVCAIDQPRARIHCAPMTFASRMTRAPRPFDPDRGADGLAHLPGIDAGLHELIAGAAGCSPYLLDLMRTDGDWLTENIDSPEVARDAILVDVAAMPLADLNQGLRTAKRRMALLVALADLGGVWPLETVTKAITDLADGAVDTCIRRLVAAEIARGKLPGMDETDAQTSGGMVALSMGKQGAYELNYSSDIDLICLFDETRFAPDDYHDARAAFIRVARKMTSILSDLGAGGYVFRTDLRLRPDASVTPVCLSMETAERYYESVGRTWERAAYIKARASAGDIKAGEGFLRTLTPFVWRKHLDFAAIQDAHDMRLRIRDHKGLGGKLSLPGHNIKLGRGGIREIEFFTQTRQLIAGGRDPSLRARGTCDGLDALVAANWVPDDGAQTLKTHYRSHREVEHRLQMINDAQTHDLPSSGEGFDRLAAFMGVARADLERDLRDRLEEVHSLTEGFFAPDAVAAAPVDNFGKDITARWLTYPALRSDRAAQIFHRLRPEILSRLQDAAKPDEALLQFDGFLAGLPAGVQLFSLFESNPQLTKLIVDIAATAPALAQYLSRNAGVFDAVIGGGFFAPWPDPDDLQASLMEALDGVADYEGRLDMARRWNKEWNFRVGVHHLQGLIDGVTAGEQYAQLAQAVVVVLWPHVTDQFALKHGPAPGRGAAVLAMGSLGAGRLNAMSDLDLIVIYDPQGVDDSHGPRPLPTRTYFARLTQALVTALSAQMPEGRLYEVDMRLRPSGRAGPVATALTAFEAYQRTEAWTWEHLALTRARSIAGDEGLRADIESTRCAVLADKASGENVLQDVSEMRDRIAAAKPPQGRWDAKIGAGRLQDIELLAQTACLRAGGSATTFDGHIRSGVVSGWLSDADGAALTTAYGLFWRLQVAARLLTGGALDPAELGEGGVRFILRETDMETTDALAAAMAEAANTAGTIIARLLG